jgi:hypothetical protein
MDELERLSAQILSATYPGESALLASDGAVDELINNLIDATDREIGIALTAGKSDLAVGMLSQSVTTVNAAIAAKKGLAAKLQKYVNKFLAALEKIAKSAGADSYSITVGAPAGVSFTMNWDV